MQTVATKCFQNAPDPTNYLAKPLHTYSDRVQCLGEVEGEKKLFNDSSKLTIFLQLSLRTNTHTEFFTLLMAAAGRMLFTYEPIIRRSTHYRILGRAWDHEIHKGLRIESSLKAYIPPLTSILFDSYSTVGKRPFSRRFRGYN